VKAQEVLSSQLNSSLTASTEIVRKKNAKKIRNQETPHKFGKVIKEGERINPCQADSINKTEGDLLEELLTIVNNRRSKIRRIEDVATLNTIDQSTDRASKRGATRKQQRPVGSVPRN
jgi:hypothetical protein